MNSQICRRAAGIFLLASGTTGLLLLIPRGPSQKAYQTEAADPIFIWRNSLTVLLGLCSVLSPLLMLKLHWAEPVYAKSLDRQSGIIRRRVVSIEDVEKP